MRRLLVTGQPIGSSWQQRFEDLGFTVTNGSERALLELGEAPAAASRELTEPELARALSETEVYIYGGLEPAGADALLPNAKSLDLISFMGTGWSDPGCVDPAAATAARVRVTNTPHANAPSVAEFTAGAILAASRHAFSMAAETAGGNWTPVLGTDVGGKTLGIVGLGAIGSQVARQMRHAFNMRVLYFSRSEKLDVEMETDAQRVSSLEELFETCDVVSVHLSANSDTLGIIGKSELERARPGAILINMASPELVDVDALIESIDSRAIRAVFDGRYPDPKHNESLMSFGLDRYTSFPRTAWLTAESYDRIAAMAFDSIHAYCDGLPIPHLVLDL